MSSIIGSRYFENLIRIKGAVRNLLYEGFQEIQMVIILPCNGGRCYYDNCFDKKVRSNKRPIIMIQLHVWD